MAKQTGDTLLEGFSGKIGGQLVVRKTKRGLVLGVRPRGDGEETDKQKKWREKFAMAVSYATGVQHDPTYKEFGDKRDLSGFNVATADFLHPPELAESLLDNYNGKAGDVIRVRAIDDVKVTTVGIVIVGPNDTVIEEGKMTQDGIDKTLWSYTAVRDANANHVKLLVDIADLPGHITRETVEKDI